MLLGSNNTHENSLAINVVLCQPLDVFNTHGGLDKEFPFTFLKGNQVTIDGFYILTVSCTIQNLHRNINRELKTLEMGR